jgi:predicted GNAT superfamily acetyltransferase
MECDNEAVRRLTSLDPSSALILNNAHAKETSELDLAGMIALIHIARYARGIDGGATALLIALDQTAPYVNPNFAWFKARLESFVYIDRVIVAASARGKGLARLLYEDLFTFARQAGQTRAVCEVNLDPPNSASDAFHANMGFLEIGQAAIHSGVKTVRYFEKSLA